MNWRVVYTKQAQKDARKLAAAGPRDEADTAAALVEALTQVDLQAPPAAR